MIDRQVISREYPLYMLMIRPLLAYLDIIIRGLKDSEREPICIFFGLSRSVYHALRGISAIRLLSELEKVYRPRNENAKRIEEEKGIEEKIFSNYEERKFFPCIIITKENIWKKIHPRRITERFKKEILGNGDAFTEKLLNLIYSKGLNAVAWRISLRRGRDSLGIYHIPIFNVKERTRTLIRDIIIGLSNSPSPEGIKEVLESIIFILMLDDPYETTSTLESILSALKSVSPHIGRNEGIPPIIIALPGIGLLRNKDIINRIGGLVKIFFGNATRHSEGYAGGPLNFPPLISDGIIDIEKEVVEVISAHYDALREKNKESMHLYLCVKDLPGVLWDISLRLAGIRKNLKEEIYNKIYGRKKDNVSNDTVEILIPNLSHVRIKMCSYRPFISGYPFKEKIISSNFTLETAVEFLKFSNKGIIQQCIKKFLLIDDGRSNYILGYWSKILNRPSPQKDGEDTIKRIFKDVLSDSQRAKPHQCPSEITCPIAIKHRSQDTNVDSGEWEFKQFISGSERTLRALIQVCATGWERPGAVAFILTLLSSCGIISGDDDSRIKDIVDIVANAYTGSSQREQWNIRYISAISCVNPVNTLLELILVKETRNRALIPPLVRSIVVFGKDDGGVLEKYVKKIVTFLNTFYKEILGNSNTNSASDLYKYERAYGAYIIYNKYIGLCDVIQCPLGKRSLKILLAPIYTIIDTIISESCNQEEDAEQVIRDIMAKINSIRERATANNIEMIKVDTFLEGIKSFVNFIANGSKPQQSLGGNNIKIEERIKNWYKTLKEIHDTCKELETKREKSKNGFLRELINIVEYILRPLTLEFGETTKDSWKETMKKRLEYFSDLKKIEEENTIMKSLKNFLSDKFGISNELIRKLFKLEFIIVQIADRMHFSIASPLTEIYPFKEFSLYEKNVLNKIGW